VSLGTAEMRGREVSLVGINICRWPLPNSLTGPRDIEACLRSLGGKLYHMGFHSRVARSTLADANDSHDWRIYADFAHVLIRLARPLYAADPIDVDLDQSLYALDSTTIDLCLSLFPWAKFRRHKAAVKMHTLLDLHGNIPTFISITSGRVHDVNKQSADAAKSASETSAKQLEMAERPWISLNFTVRSGLSFKNGEGRIIIGMIPNNVGHSVAAGVEYELRFIVPFLERPDPASIRDRLCQDLEGRSALPHNKRFHQTWFPGQQPEVIINLPISAKDIHAGMVDIPRSLFPDSPPKPTNIWPILIACVAYRPSFVNVRYSTGYIIDLLHVDPSTWQPVLMIPTGEIPLNGLRLQQHFGVGTTAK